MDKLALSLMATILLGTASRATARQIHIELDEYVAKAKTICVCRVTKENDDGSVTTRVDQTVKGELPEKIVISGVTGDVAPRTVNIYMQTGKTYLVFLFEDHKVSQNGHSIVPVLDGMLRVDGVRGFTDVQKDEEGHKFLPLAEGLGQIQKKLWQPSE